MTTTTLPALQHEWHTLQNNHEQYERSALFIKLTTVVLAAVGIGLGFSPLKVAVVIAILWLQEGILRTSQSRIGARILSIEEQLLHDTGAHPCQLHSAWLAGRSGTFGLLKEYLANALRPTVAYPYAVLIALTAVQYGLKA